MQKFSILIIATIIVAVGCLGLGDNPVITLWSNSAEILAFVDRYNAIQDKFKIQVAFVESPADELIITDRPPDLILGERLSAPRCAAKLQALDSLLSGNGVNPALLYKALLKNNLYNNVPVAIPFSFNLPVIVYRKGTYKSERSGTISLGDIKNSSRDYNGWDKSRLVSLGFSPLWNNEFIFHAAMLFNVNFHSDQENGLVWDKKALVEYLSFLSGWYDENTYGFEREREFYKKYMYEPPYSLVQDRRFDMYRISFFQTEMHDFFSIPVTKRANLDFAWMSHEGKIPVSDRVLFFSVPRGSNNLPGAYDFLKWAFNPATQQAILEENRRKRPRAFGIADGFSSLIDVNEAEFPKFFPLLAERIPKEENLVFSFTLPETWNKLKEQTILPWMYDQLAHKEGLAPLEEKIK